MGFAPLQRLQTMEIHVLLFPRGPLCRTEVLQRRLPAGPTLLATVPLTGFLNLPAVLLLPSPSHRFQMGGTLGVMSFRGLIPLQSLS